MVHSDAILNIELKFKFVPQRVLIWDERCDNYQSEFNIDAYGALAKIGNFFKKYGVNKKIAWNKIYSPYFFLSNDTSFKFFWPHLRKNYKSDTTG